LRFLTSCMQCNRDRQDGDDIGWIKVAPNEDGVTIEVCKNGHKFAHIIQQHKFELLSQMAVLAIHDGYYRDAIVSFSACLERLREFFYFVSCLKSGISIEQYAKSWKPMANQSERQLGAFIASFVFETGSAPTSLSTKWQGVRNDVVHKGKFADREMALDFGQEITNLANEIITVLNTNDFKEHIMNATRIQSNEKLSKYVAVGDYISTTYFDTYLSLLNIRLKENLRQYMHERAAFFDFDKSHIVQSGNMNK